MEDFGTRSIEDLVEREERRDARGTAELTVCSPGRLHVLKGELIDVSVSGALLLASLPDGLSFETLHSLSRGTQDSGNGRLTAFAKLRLRDASAPGGVSEFGAHVEIARVDEEAPGRALIAIQSNRPFGNARGGSAGSVLSRVSRTLGQGTARRDPRDVERMLENPDYN